MKRLLRTLIPALLVVAWLVAAAVGGPTFGKLDQVSDNDPSAFLPSSAESTVVREWQQKFVESDTIPAIVVIESNDTLSQEAVADYAGLAEDFSKVDGVAETSTGSPAVIGPIPSEDGKAVQLIVRIDGNADAGPVVEEMRTILTEQIPEGSEGYVTGPAGFTTDLTKAFAGIDGILLGVALGVVFVILLAVYRSVILPFLVLFTSVGALTASILVIYFLADAGWIQLSGQSQGILSILVIGAATDYALLLTARYREALLTNTAKWDAMRIAYRGSFAPILASGATVIAALLCLLFSDLNSNRSLGPIAATGIAFSLLAALSLLPSLLLLFGRSAFWPLRPTVRDHQEADAGSTSWSHGLRGIWLKVPQFVAGKPRIIWAGALIILLAGSTGLLQLKASGVPQSTLILGPSQAVDGQDALARHFDAGSGSPVLVVAEQDTRADVAAIIEDQEGISTVTLAGSEGAPGAPSESEPKVVDGRILFNAVLDYEPDSAEAEAVVEQLRVALDDAGLEAQVGGTTAVAFDTSTTAQADLQKIIPLVLAVILLILIILLRSLVAPLLLIGTVLLSYGTAMGVSALVFNHIFNFPGADASVPLFGFVFLVALGVDYNIFLMTRVREESKNLGTRPGILRGLGVTGGVITSAGIVLAATFSALGVIPILFLVQLAFIVAFGVLLDTIIVRSLLVPALAYDIGNAIWWPSKLGRKTRDMEELRNEPQKVASQR
ncbi:MMPL family transporter [Arthrobacter roseus]|uniref:MMPL family transporter n=1 Tax=Arthrobacter roseus TaxID=136274 RepID=UPI001EF8EEAD|nr:MMPL family transporter [Arthrobacter roseus]MBM7849508.1 RND superfamily putative drug exporter [Arthrobacter roseus]